MKNKLNCLVLFFLIILLSSCYHKSKSITINDFSQSIHDTLEPKKKWSYYTTALFEISGYSNDTIKVKFYGIERKSIGKFKRKMKMDYYGGLKVDFKFDPYKATKGELEIKYEIF